MPDMCPGLAAALPSFKQSAKPVPVIITPSDALYHPSVHRDIQFFPGAKRIKIAADGTVRVDLPPHLVDYAHMDVRIKHIALRPQT